MELSMTPLRQRMIEDMQVRNLARHTQRAYLQQISLFARHFGKSPDILGPADIRAYQLHLSQEKRLSASSIMVAVAAMRFLYKVTLGRGWDVDEIIPACRKAQKLPAVLSQDEVARFLDAVDSLPIPTKPPVCNGMIAPRDSWMMPPPCNEMIPPGRRACWLKEVLLPLQGCGSSQIGRAHV